MFKQIKHTAFAAMAALLFSATMIGAAIGPVQIGQVAHAARA
jgi:hypothetical protein